MNHRHLIAATSGVFILSDAVFALSLQPLTAIAVIAGCVGALAIIATARGGDSDGFLAARVDARFFLGCLAASLIIFVLGGEGHFFYAVGDWLIRDAALADVARTGVATVYAYEGHDYALRAPLGMYLLPGLVWKAAGLFGAHLAMLAQNTGLLASTLYVLGSLVPRRRIAALTLFLLFAGVDILPVLAIAWQRYAQGHPFSLPHSTVAWLPSFTFWYPLPSLFWVPNHTLPAWWGCALALLVVRRRIDLAAFAAAMAPMALWTPLGIVGWPPFLLLMAAAAPVASIRCVRNWLAAGSGCLFLPVAIYLTTASESIPAHWAVLQDGFWPVLVAMLLVQIPHALIVACFWRRVCARDRGLLGLSIALLILIPFYDFGPINDLAVRGSNMPLAILDFEFALVALQIMADKASGGRLAVALVIGLGLFGPGFELVWPLTRPRFNISDCDLLQASDDYTQRAQIERFRGGLPTHYVAPVERMPPWLIRFDGAKPISYAPKSCWPDHPVLGQIPAAPETPAREF